MIGDLEVVPSSMTALGRDFAVVVNSKGFLSLFRRDFDTVGDSGVLQVPSQLLGHSMAVPISKEFPWELAFRVGCGTAITHLLQ
jgi:hypothetical protein